MYIHLHGLAQPRGPMPRRQPKLPVPVPKTIGLYNTDLNAPYFGGNFNFLYNGGANEATITFNAYLSYRKNYTDTQKRDFVNFWKSFTTSVLGFEKLYTSSKAWWKNYCSNYSGQNSSAEKRYCRLCSLYN
jgi:hypothetical protein